MMGERPDRGNVQPVTEQGILPIVECGDPVLRRPAEPVSRSDLGTSQLQQLIAQLRATMEAAPGVGLAAPQVGVPIQLAVLQDGPERWGRLTEDERTARQRYGLPFTVLINPTVQPVESEGSVSFYEGCLSVPGLTGVVARHRAVHVEALNEDGEPVDQVFSGWAARIVQHETDHLGGLLYLDRVETRSLSTTGNYARLWAGRPPKDASASLGFPLG
jgi:peptide deformylase